MLIPNSEQILRFLRFSNDVGKRAIRASLLVRYRSRLTINGVVELEQETADLQLSFWQSRSRLYLQFCYGYVKKPKGKWL
jgi:hypothetical protein